MKTRRERDSLGERDVPADALYGIQTARSLEHFDAGREVFPLHLVRNVIRLKRACALANRDLGELEPRLADAIAAACDEALTGAFDAAFPVDVYQAGSGTSTHMNVNEVLANAAAERLGARRGDRSAVHPNDHVNRGQSTNNIIPSAIRMSGVELGAELDEAAGALEQSLRNKADAFRDVRKSGRTHLQDAVPSTLGLSFGAFARAVEKDRARLAAAGEPLRELGAGGNAIGTGINAPDGFREAIVRRLNEATGGRYRIAEDGVEITQFLTDLLGFSGALRCLAADLLKIANDLRLLASGPNAGLGEIRLPAVEPGSSIMPGKINPSLCEAANMICLQVMGLDQALGAACAAGQLELNTHMPLVGGNLVREGELLIRCCRMLAERCIDGIEANPEVCASYFNRSAGLATALNPVLGYDRVAELVKQCLAEKKTLRELALENQLLSERELDALLERAVRAR
jgi:aspartate ammonia-lyase